MALSDKIKYESQEKIEGYKQKYSDYKTKLKKANISIQTLTKRLAKYELQMAAEREIGRVDSVRMLAGQIGSEYSGGKVLGALQGRAGVVQNIKSTGSAALSPATGYG